MQIKVMLRMVIVVLAAVVAVVTNPGAVDAGGHLWWNGENINNANCLYGEVTVLATNPNIYYCGANWHPGEPAGGYCGIQHNTKTERRTIFSIWDTSATLHPQITQADPRTYYDRFGGEGTGAHTHMQWNWQLGETFKFFVYKKPGAKQGTTDTRYYVNDHGKWILSATITNPNGDNRSAASVSTIGGGLNSFLENWSGLEPNAPKLALYRLWLGNSLDTMKCLTRTQGDEKWGKLNDCYFLAEGDDNALNTVFSKLEKQYGKPVWGNRNIEPISNKPIPAQVISDLKSLVQK